MAAISLSNTDIIFGVLDQSYGYFDGLTFTEKVNVTRSIGPGGDTERVHYSGREVEVSGSYVYRKSANSPASGPLGFTFTGLFITLAKSTLIDSKSDDTWPTGLDGAKIFISEVTHNYTKNDFKRIDFFGIYFPNLKSGTSPIKTIE